MQAPSYDQIATLLSTYGDAMSVSECHGVLCGMASCNRSLGGDEWAGRMLSGDLDEAVSSAMAAEVDEADRATLKALFDDTVRQMNDSEMSFQLLLPDEDEALEERTAALADWCDGYLYGLSLGGIKDFEGCSEEVQEFCGDLVEISQISYEDSDEGENEKAFFEIAEYVRMGVLMVYEDMENPSTKPAGVTEHKITFH
jgi:hypothetical protein